MIITPKKPYINRPFLEAFEKGWIKKHTQRTFRKAIQHQELVLRNEFNTKFRYSLDHYPIPLKSIKRIFLKQKGINPDELRKTDITMLLLQDWQIFHGEHAEYRLIDVKLNWMLGNLQAQINRIIEHCETQIKI
jgi:hypothetical protein